MSAHEPKKEYQVFARKYRPQSFDEVLGQEGVVRTLKNAITLTRLHHAYLFCGARGVGKTSLARIFAKSINCEKGPTLTPCQTCSVCRGITSGSAMDVLEIDGASNTGVDDVRELREQVKYLPNQGQYKIIIIDEVHMLSTNAFNALLKTLEEPPAHVLFVLATTEPHKLPITILSRCQRFDFRKMPVTSLVGHLAKILKSEELTYPEESLTLVARMAEGSVRDALSLLDQIVSFCGESAPVEAVRDILGLSDRTLILECLSALLSKQSDPLLNVARRLYEKGGDLKIFAEGLLEVIYQLLILSKGGDKYLEIAPSERDELKKMLSQTDSSVLLALFQILNRGIEDIIRAEMPQMVFEVTLLKMLEVEQLFLLSESLEALSTSSSAPVPTASLATNKNSEIRPPAFASRSLASRPPVSAPQGATPIAHLVEKAPTDWKSFVKKCLEKKPQIGAILERALLVSMTHNNIVLGFEENSPYEGLLKERLPLVLDLIKQTWGREISVTIDSKKGAEKNSEVLTPFAERKKEESAHHQERVKQALENDSVKKLQNMFGATVAEVKPSTSI